MKFHGICRCKNFENRSTFGEDMDKNLRFTFLDHPVHPLSEILVVFCDTFLVMPHITNHPWLKYWDYDYTLHIVWYWLCSVVWWRVFFPLWEPRVQPVPVWPPCPSVQPRGDVCRPRYSSELPQPGVVPPLLGSARPAPETTDKTTFISSWIHCMLYSPMSSTGMLRSRYQCGLESTFLVSSRSRSREFQFSVSCELISRSVIDHRFLNSKHVI